MIIDDEVQIRRLLEITLSAHDYKIIKAGDGKEGLIAAATHQPACILLDLGLPDKDGLEILKDLLMGKGRMIATQDNQNVGMVCFYPIG